MASRFGTIRVLRYGGLMMAGAATFGAKGGCDTDYDAVSDVSIDMFFTQYPTETEFNKIPKGVPAQLRWEREGIANRRTHGWNAQGLLPVAGPVTFPGEDMRSVATVTALGSREFFIFNRPSPTQRYGMIQDTIHASAVGGKAARVPFRANMARFIDHGACRTRLPFIQDDGKGLLQVIKGGVERAFHDKIRAKGREPTTHAFLVQSSFFLANDAGTEVRDGFGMAFSFSAQVDVLPDADIKFGVNYAAYLEHGFAGIYLLPGGRVHTYHPTSTEDEVALNNDVQDALRNKLPGKLRAIGLYGDAAAGVAARAQPTFVLCEDQPADFCGKAPGARNWLGFLLRSKMDQMRAMQIANALSPEGFECRKKVEDVDDQAEETDYDRCWWHPAAKRVNVMPKELELVWSDPDNPEPADVLTLNALTSGSTDCKPVRTTSSGQHAGLTDGDLDDLYEDL